MWPELLDMTREESKRILRRVELEAYSSVVSAFRSQGDLTKDKKKILHDLQQMLSISTERHRAEVRRAVNDEKLATIAENMSPSNSTQEWLIEGRRLVPLMPRLVPQTAFTVTANQVANMQAEKNASLPSPSQTGIREASTAPQMASPPQTPRASSRSSSPTSNVVVLPSGMSIHIKGGLNTEDDEDIQIRKRKRSTSTENLVSPTGTPIPQVTYTTTMASVPTVSPKKITISKSPQSQPRVVMSGSQTQKVILVSGQSQTQQGLIPQKSVTGPHRSTVSTGTSTSTHSVNKSIIYPSSSVATNTNIGNVVTMSTQSSVSMTTSSVVTPLSSVGTSTTAFLTPTISVSRPRFKTVPRQKILQVPQPRPGVVIPMGPQPVQPSPQSLQGLKPVNKNTPTIQIRQEGGMKIITQNIQGSTSKILPKPSQLSSSSGTPVVVVSAGSSTPVSTVTMVNKVVSSLSGTQAGTKVLNIQTQGGKIFSAPRGSSVVTVNPKTLHLTAVKNAAGITGTKPNVIVVQKTQPRRTGSLTTAGTSQIKSSTTAVISSPFEKELVSFLQKQDPTKQYVVTTTTANLSKTSDNQRKVIVTTSGHSDLAKQLTKTLQQSRMTETTQQSSTILHDLIQAAGIVPDSNQENPSGEVTINIDESQLAALTSAAQTQPNVSVSQAMPNNEWFEYDVTDEQGNTFTHTAESADTAAAIQSLLDMQANNAGQKPKVTVQKSASVDIGQLSDHLNQQQFYTIEQAMTILNQPESSTEKEVQSQPAVSVIHNEPQSQTILDSNDSSEDMYTAVPLKSVIPATHIPVTHIPTTQIPATHISTTQIPAAHISTTQIAVSQSPATQIPTSHIQTINIPSSQSTSTIILPSVSSTSVTQGVKATHTPGVKRGPYPEDQGGGLDPETGVFYVDKNNSDIVTKEVVIVKSGNSSASESAKNYDLLSSSLAQAQIDLDPFQFIDESQINTKTVETETVVQPSETTIIDSPNTETVETTPSVPINQQVIVQKVVVTTPITAGTQTVRIQPSSTFIPLQEMVKTGTGKPSTISITSAKQIPTTLTLTPQSAVTLTPQSSVTLIPQSTAPSSIHVTVEPSGIDTSYMKMEDFTSQQLTERGDFVGVGHMEEIATLSSPSGGSGLSDSQGESSNFFDSQPNKRKRQYLSGDESSGSPPSGQGAAGSWVRAALGVLNKVSKYRGINREKNDLNASAWFTQPVDPEDAPDYYTIVEHPMDFGTIKRKLEANKYITFDDFHADMVLIRDNCFLYNPEQSRVRKDCDEVFTFYNQEYNRLLEKWQKTHIASPVSKKPRTDRSPIRP